MISEEKLKHLLASPLVQLASEDDKLKPSLSDNTILWVQMQRNALALRLLSLRISAKADDFTNFLQEDAFIVGKLSAFEELLRSAQE